MKRQSVIIIAVAIAMIAATALFLGTWQHRQRLGQPGVRVVNQPLQGIDLSPGVTNTFVASSNSIYLPEKVLAYKSDSSPIPKLVLDWLPRDTTYGQRFYRAEDGFEILTMAVLMGKDRTSIHQPQYCLYGSGWQIASEEATVISMDKPVPYELPVMKLKVTRTDRDHNGKEHTRAGMFVYWFVADQQLTADHRTRMWWLARDLLRSGVLQRWAYVTEFAICHPGQEEAAFARISEFIRASVPEFQLTPPPDKTLALGK